MNIGASQLITKKRLGIIFTLPNLLTLFRIFVTPLFFIFFFYFPTRVFSLLASLLFALASLTDFLDGYIARRWNLETSLGKFLDPLADKILVSLTMIMLIPLGRIYVWMVMVIIARELAITGLRSIAVGEGIVIQASALGKYKTIFQSIALVGLCLHYEYFGVDFQTVGMLFMWIAVLMTIWSGVAYFRHFYGVFFPKKKPAENQRNGAP